MVNAAAFFELEAGESRTVAKGKVILDGFVICELTQAEPASVLVCGVGSMGQYFRVRVQPGAAVPITGLACACPWGLEVVQEMGYCSISVLYR